MITDNYCAVSGYFPFRDQEVSSSDEESDEELRMEETEDRVEAQRRQEAMQAISLQTLQGPSQAQLQVRENDTWQHRLKKMCLPLMSTALALGALFIASWLQQDGHGTDGSP